jgi:hypothetical protein
MRKLLSFICAFVLCCGLAGAQDYFLTGDRHATPVKVGSFLELDDILKKQNKANRYQVIFLDMDESRAVFMVAPKKFRQETGEDGLSLGDPDDENFMFEISVSKNSAAQEAESTVKEYSSGSKLLSQGNVSMGGKPGRQIVFDNRQEKGAATVFIMSYGGKTFKFSAFESGPARGKYATAVRDMISSLGTAQVESSAKAAPSKQTAQPRLAELPGGRGTSAAAKELTKEAAGEPHRARNITLGGLSQKAKDTKTSQISFSAGDSFYSFEVPSSFTASLKDGRIFFKNAPRSKNIFFVEASGPSSKEYYEAAVKTAGGGVTLKQTAQQNIKAGARAARMTRKIGLNIVSVNYFFKENDAFTVSYIGDPKEEKLFDAAAKNIISTITYDFM